jgi:hypothetical protein
MSTAELRRRLAKLSFSEKIKILERAACPQSGDRCCSF